MTALYIFAAAVLALVLVIAGLSVWMIGDIHRINRSVDENYSHPNERKESR